MAFSWAVDCSQWADVWPRSGRRYSPGEYLRPDLGHRDRSWQSGARSGWRRERRCVGEPRSWRVPYVSPDGGVNWTQRRTSRTWSLSIAPTGGPMAEILAACSDGSWQSTDGGTTWNAVTLPGSPGAFNRFAVAIAPSNPTVAYAWGAGAPFVLDSRLNPPQMVPTAYLWRRAGG